jgi:hypothetical protein
MKNCLLNEINESFMKGYIPDSLTYQLEEKNNIDFNKMWYNDYYQSIDYISRQYPKGWDSLIGFDKVLESIAKEAPLPLEEMEIRNNQSKLLSHED